MEQGVKAGDEDDLDVSREIPAVSLNRTEPTQQPRAREEGYWKPFWMSPAHMDGSPEPNLAS